MSSGFRTADRIAADEFCSVMHLRVFLGRGDLVKEEIGRCLGFDERDLRWVSPSGEDLTRLCDSSSIGGFSSSCWTIRGWVLDESSMAKLRDEFPDSFS